MAVPDCERVTILSWVRKVVSAVSELGDLELSTVRGTVFSCRLFLLTSPEGVSTM